MATGTARALGGIGQHLDKAGAGAKVLRSDVARLAALIKALGEAKAALERATALADSELDGLSQTSAWLKQNNGALQKIIDTVNTVAKV